MQLILTKHVLMGFQNLGSQLAVAHRKYALQTWHVAIAKVQGKRAVMSSTNHQLLMSKTGD